MDETTAPPAKTEAGVEEYAKLASDSAALDTEAPDKKGAGVDEPYKTPGVEEPKDPSKSGAGVEDPAKAPLKDETAAESEKPFDENELPYANGAGVEL